MPRSQPRITSPFPIVKLNGFPFIFESKVLPVVRRPKYLTDTLSPDLHLYPFWTFISFTTIPSLVTVSPFLLISSFDLTSFFAVSSFFVFFVGATCSGCFLLLGCLNSSTTSSASSILEPSESWSK
eukprot:NODE_1174_length_1904_cov_0.962881.p3 type:complete len:126 gc:universal NODE_1174_length_1904_cov_0.962881:796-1173(+)